MKLQEELQSKEQQQSKKNKRKKKKRQKAKQQKQEQRMLVKNGIPVEDDDVYCMLLPGETEHSIGKKGKKSNLRSPFEEGHVYDNRYEFQHRQTC